VCKVRFRKVRRAELGDKLCSRHGQKGVIGMIIPAEDMPFTKDGIVPDIIINPHAIPSRMTIGHLVECIFAKVCTLEGALGDGSVFIPVDYEKLGSDLEKFKFEKNGNEVLYNGKTGRQIDTEIFIGPTYYLRLKHMVADKMHSRDKGPKDQLTRQPPSGRSNEGGLRIGEMERDVVLSYGFSQFSKESVMERSDKYTWAVCKCCGRTSSYNPEKAIYHCIGCDTQDIAVIQTPYSYKLMTHELEAMGVSPRLITDDVEYESLEDDIYESEDEGVHQVGGGGSSLQSTFLQKGGVLEDPDVFGGGDDDDDGEQESSIISGGDSDNLVEESSIISGGDDDNLEEESSIISGGDDDNLDEGEEDDAAPEGESVSGGDSDNLVEYRTVEI
jgi:hypothetical protein